MMDGGGKRQQTMVASDGRQWRLATVDGDKQGQMVAAYADRQWRVSQLSTTNSFIKNQTLLSLVIRFF